MMKIGDVINFGDPMPDDVLEFTDRQRAAEGNEDHFWQRRANGFTYLYGSCDPDSSDGAPYEHFAQHWFPLVVTKVRGSEPIALTLPVVPDDAVALIGGRTGERYTERPGVRSWASTTYQGAFHAVLGREGSVTVVMPTGDREP